ncbi:MAG: hypothetical protein ACTSVB_04990 [Candidatus Heimdallarchaeaceae archaeon]|uniref:Uncharacterized protein n=1 Tax=Candidatus Heimdallarchaeum endolithica TaxID=2876572 RepID=A0A9Y1BQ21_9ARCH|nr:MAG: hypothetical protein K9W46_12075 [Candidatus Heimdallarchaeum endolithica]
MIHAIYIIDRSGIPLFFREKEENSSDITRATLFSGVISAIQSLLKDMEIGEATEVSTKAYDILLEVAMNFAVIVVIDPCVESDKTSLRTELTRFTTKVSFEIKDVVDANLVRKEEQMLNQLTDEFIKNCEQILNTSEATKRLRDSLW